MHCRPGRRNETDDFGVRLVEANCGNESMPQSSDELLFLTISLGMKSDFFLLKFNTEISHPGCILTILKCKCTRIYIHCINGLMN